MKRNLITQETFDSIKKLLSENSNPRKVAAQIGRGYETVRQIKMAESFELYKINRHEYQKDYFNRKENMKVEKRRITEEEYKKIKDLLFEGNTAAEIAAIVGRSHTVVIRVKNSQNLEDFYKISKEYFKNYKRKYTKVPITVPIQEDEHTILWKTELDQVIQKAIDTEVEEKTKVLSEENARLQEIINNFKKLLDGNKPL